MKNYFLVCFLVSSIAIKAQPQIIKANEETKTIRSFTHTFKEFCLLLNSKSNYKEKYNYITDKRFVTRLSIDTIGQVTRIELLTPQNIDFYNLINKIQKEIISNVTLNNKYKKGNAFYYITKCYLTFDFDTDGYLKLSTF